MSDSTFCPNCEEEAVMLTDGSIYCVNCGRLERIQPDDDNT